MLTPPIISKILQHKISLVLSLILLAMVLVAIWLTPWIPILRHGPVEVIRWERMHGEIRKKIGPLEEGWVPIESVSKNVLFAIVISEDMRFFEHSGFDFREIWNSFKTNLRYRRFIRGGSTITQQVIKLAFLSREKTIVRKIKEALGTLWLEMILDKKQILEWYINLADFGNGVYGIKDAASFYFGTKQERLTIEEAANLALVLPSPNNWSLGLKVKHLTPFGHRRFADIIDKMYFQGYITKTQRLNAMVSGDFGEPIIGFGNIQNKDDVPLTDDISDGIWDDYDNYINKDDLKNKKNKKRIHR